MPPDWLLAVPRLLWAPVTWGRRRVRRWAVSRQELVREGSEVVTPVIHLARSLGPASIVWGGDEQHRGYLQERNAKWQELRVPLTTYANLHPSDDVRALGHEVEIAVSSALSDTIFLLSSRHGEGAHGAYEASKRSHEEALEKAERLIALIRDY